MIIKINNNQKDLLEEALSEYQGQIFEGLIKPTFSAEIDVDDNVFEVLLFAKSESGVFQGFMNYEKLYFKNHKDFLSRSAFYLPSKVKISDILYISNLKPNQYIGKVCVIESFPKLKGTRRSLIEAAIEDPDMAGMFLHSTPRAREFYKALGFKEFNHPSYGNRAFMGWQREKRK